MKVLVIEDTKRHQESARETLSDHELTIVTSFDEAIEALDTQYDEARIEQLKAESGLAYGDDGYREMLSEVTSQCTLPLPWDVVLTDMMMPMSKANLAPSVHNHRELIPYGFIIALRAAEAGAKLVAVVTDVNHHMGAISAAMDNLSSPSYHGCPNRFTINGAKCAFVHTPFSRRIVEKDAKCSSCRGTGKCSYCQDTGREDSYPCTLCPESSGICRSCNGSGKKDKTETTDCKDWGRVLKDLTAKA